jgi:phosphopantetheinyl transferase
MPFHLALELMAQAAQPHFAGQVLTAVSKARAIDWLLLEEEKLPVRIVVQPQATAGESLVSLYKNHPSRPGGEQLALQAVMHFADAAPSAPAAAARIEPQEPGPCLLAGQEIYPKHMFHGPALQSVAALQQCGPESVTALLRNPAAGTVPPGGEKDRYLTAPFFLDGAGQVVGLWAARQLEQHFVVFPTSVERITFYGDAAQSPPSLICRAEPRRQEDATILSDFRLYAPDGTLFADLTGLRHRRIIMPEIMHHFRGSREVLLSTPWELPVAAASPADHPACSLLRSELVDLAGSDGEVLLAVLAHIILSRRERRHWYEMQAAAKRRREWLLGRLVAKETIRRLLRKMGREDVWSADIEIVPDKNGRPEVAGSWLPEGGCRLAFSVSHTDHAFAALAACLPGDGAVGLDMEEDGREPDEAFLAFSFTDEERKIIAGDRITALRCWCAKEAAAKALGFGLPGGPRDLMITGYEERTGAVSLRPSGVLAGEYGQETDGEVRAFTGLADGLVAAVAVAAGRGA